MLPALLLLACNPDPGEVDQGVTYRPGLADGPQTGERGNVSISEILWSGSVTNDGDWDPRDVFLELRNEGSMPIDLTGWQLQVEGAVERTFVLPEGGPILDVGAHGFVAAKSSGCFPEPDWVVDGLDFGHGDGFEVTLRDFDEHLIEGAGDEHAPPFAGGYDTKKSRSMEKVELMFGGEGNMPHIWHFYTKAEVDVPNDDRIAEGCRLLTYASPGRPNSPDYSGAYASGSFE